MMRANLPAGTGPKPALHDGKPIIHTHPSGGQVYLANDGTGWWKVEAMPAPTEVLVPVSLTFREQVQALRDEMFENLESPDHMVSLDLVVERLDALLSQPTPSAEAFCDLCGGPFTDQAWLMDGYGGHWDTCPNGVATNENHKLSKGSIMNDKATVVTLDGKKHKKLPLTALASPGGAMMRPGVLPVAYWINGDGTGRTFHGVTREHAFQRALRWGRDAA